MFTQHESEEMQGPAGGHYYARYCLHIQCGYKGKHGLSPVVCHVTSPLRALFCFRMYVSVLFTVASAESQYSPHKVQCHQPPSVSTAQLIPSNMPVFWGGKHLSFVLTAWNNVSTSLNCQGTDSYFCQVSQRGQYSRLIWGQVTACLTHVLPRSAVCSILRLQPLSSPLWRITTFILIKAIVSLPEVCRERKTMGLVGVCWI